MCLAVPGLILEISKQRASVDVRGARIVADLRLVPEAHEGDYVLVHAGFALQVVDSDEANETLALLDEVDG
ncbi:MAG: HypC/HybG/HupF family hydrogenase formation chaperone [Gemmatimonadetes bacterium]|nr:HypC/HybG/HupF family hydrogenase formation chaperone [Gemmatimonadota bacterium]